VLKKIVLGNITADVLETPASFSVENGGKRLGGLCAPEGGNFYETIFLTEIRFSREMF
jgi:hypothetical protein